jgi:Helix-turn-helix domain
VRERPMASDEMRVLTGDAREKISAAVQRVDAIQISPDLARVLVHWLGRLAEVLARQNSCAPEALVAVQHALAEAYAAGSGDSRHASRESIGAYDLLALGHDFVDTEAAADMLGLKADTVRWHCRNGNLESQKFGRHLMIRTSSIDNFKFKYQRIERSA